MEKKETAEQKLLKIIENSKAGEQPNPPASVPVSEPARQIEAAVKGTGLPPISLPNTLAPLMGLLRGKGPGAGTFTIGPKEINTILSFTVLVITAFFVASLLSGVKLLKQQVDFDMDTSATQEEEDFNPSVIPFSAYADNIQKRNIFLPYEKKEVQASEEEASDIKHIAAMAKSLKLVGISWLDSPESASAMIEDTQTATTYFLKSGDKINDITIKGIFADRVILSYQGEELSIRL